MRIGSRFFSLSEPLTSNVGKKNNVIQHIVITPSTSLATAEVIDSLEFGSTDEHHYCVLSPHHICISMNYGIILIRKDYEKSDYKNRGIND